MQIIINKDIREYKVKDIGPLTLREAGFAILAIFTIFASRAIQRALLGHIFRYCCIFQQFHGFCLDSLSHVDYLLKNGLNPYLLKIF